MPEFVASTGNLALDFINTRGGPGGLEFVPKPSDLGEWGVWAGLLSKRKASHLDGADYGTAIEVRSTLFTVIGAIANKKTPSKNARTRFAEELAVRLGRVGLRWAGTDAVFRWTDQRDSLDPLLGPVLKSAIDLVMGPEAQHIKLCGGTGCSLAFVDRSRRHNRRWCDMKVCGNREKSRRQWGSRKGADAQ